MGYYLTEITVKTVGTCEKGTVDARNRILKTPKDPFQDYKNDLNWNIWMFFNDFDWKVFSEMMHKASRALNM